MNDKKLSILNIDLIQSLLEVPFNLERFDLSVSIHIKNALSTQHHFIIYEKKKYVVTSQLKELVVLYTVIILRQLS